MDAEISFSSGDGAITNVSLRKILTIGRNLDNNIVLDDDLVSRNHALIRRGTDNG